MSTTKLTNAAAERAAFRPRPYEVRDTIMGNFYLRVAASKVAPTRGSKTWKVDLKTVDGKRRPETLGKFPAMSATEARAAAKAKLAGETIEQTRVHSKASNPTLEEFAEVWLAERKDNKTAENQVQRTLRVWGKDTRVADITAEMVRAKQLEIAKESSNATANRAVTNLASFLSVAVEKGIRADNPAVMRKRATNGMVRRLPEDSEGGHIAFFTDEQVARMELHLPDFPRWFRDLFTVALGSGARRGELLSLNWRQVELEKGAITVLSSLAKTKRTRRIPLTRKAAEVLRQRAKDYGTEGKVWADAPHDSRAVANMDRLMELAGVEKTNSRNGEGRTSFHTLRATFASHLVQKGASIYKVSKLLGHSSVRVTEEHYGWLDQSSLEDVVSLLD